jgi:hypothetical protein
MAEKFGRGGALFHRKLNGQGQVSVFAYRIIEDVA